MRAAEASSNPAESSIADARRPKGVEDLKRAMLARVVAFGLTAAVALACGDHQRPEPIVIPVRDVSAATSASAERPASAPPPGPAAPCPAAMVLVEGAKIALEPARMRGGIENGSSLDVVVASFCLDRMEVDVQSYDQCVQAGSCSAAATRVESDDPLADQGWSANCNRARADRASHPVNCVTFSQASKYCAERKHRLPTEFEWDLAARGPERRAFPWGNDPPSAKRLNACDASCLKMLRALGPRWVVTPRPYPWDDHFAGTSPTGRFPEGATKEGVLDLAGNVGEWTSSEACTFDRARCFERSRIVRGSSFMDDGEGVSASVRRQPSADMTSPAIGFRCAADPARP